MTNFQPPNPPFTQQRPHKQHKPCPVAKNTVHPAPQWQSGATPPAMARRPLTTEHTIGEGEKLSLATETTGFTCTRGKPEKIYADCKRILTYRSDIQQEAQKEIGKMHSLRLPRAKHPKESHLACATPYPNNLIFALAQQTLSIHLIPEDQSARQVPTRKIAGEQ